MATDDFDGEPDTRTVTFAGLRWYAAAKGYQPGWASVQFKEIYGCWPNGESVAEPQTIRSRLVRWIDKRNAKYAAQKRKERHESETNQQRCSNRASSGISR